uniref:hypothetical protein n=1 Tax=Candidatus Cryptobacteroides bacterium TaxID=3085639 RepID=UPI0040277251
TILQIGFKDSEISKYEKKIITFVRQENYHGKTRKQSFIRQFGNNAVPAGDADLQDRTLPAAGHSGA